MENSPTPEERPVTTFAAFAARLVWMFIGPLILGFLALQIISTGNGWLTGADWAYLIVLAMVLAGRWLEYRGGNSRTATGEPATPDHLRRYLVGATVIGLTVWVGANFLGNHWLAR